MLGIVLLSLVVVVGEGVEVGDGTNSHGYCVCSLSNHVVADDL